MKKLFLSLLAFGFALFAIAHAQVVSPQVLKKTGSNLVPFSTSTTIGSSTVNVAAQNLTVSGTCTGCGSGGASTSTSNTFTVPQNFNGITNTGSITSTNVTVSATATFNGTTMVNAQANVNGMIFANTTSSGDYGAYLNSLCSATASGTLIWVPQGTFVYSTPS